MGAIDIALNELLAISVTVIIGLFLYAWVTAKHVEKRPPKEGEKNKK